MAIREITVGDCETDPFKRDRILKPFLFGFYNGKIYKQFATASEFVEFVRKRYCTVYFHNGGKFDFHFLSEYVDAFQDIMIINGRIAKFNIGAAEFRDSYLLLPFALDKYKKTEIDYSKFEADVRSEHMPEIEAYLKDDCVFLYDIVTKFISEYGKHLTLATTSFKLYHEKFAGEKIRTSSPGFYHDFYPFYAGGRVQSFKKGVHKGDFEVFDINSAYPYAMLHKHAWGHDYETLDYLPDEYDTCFVELDAISQGALFYKTDKGQLLFPDDNEVRRYKVTGHELRAGLETGTVEIKKIHHVHRFFEHQDFSDYVNHFYDMKNTAKQSGDKAGYLFAKLFMNSLYGKFAANPTKYSEYMTVPHDCITASEADGYSYTGDFGKNSIVERDLPENKQTFYNLATAASVTGFVRAYLFRAIYEAKIPLYCDTDSLAGVGINVELGEKLGQWEKEGDFNSAALCGKKMYCFYNTKTGKEKIATKGVKLNREQLFIVANGGEVEYKSDVPTYSVKKEPVYLSRKVKLT